MKFNRCMLLYNEKPLLLGGVRSWGKINKHPLVMLSTVPWNGDVTDDGSGEEAIKLGCMVLSNKWKYEHEQRNAGMRLSKDCDYVIWNDPDTWIEEHQLDNLVAEIESTKKDAYCIKQKTYWHNLDHCLVEDKHTPIVCVKPHLSFFDAACIDSDYHTIKTSFVHHISWCEPKNILGKLENYSHAIGKDAAREWYDKNFVCWKEGMKAVMPDGKEFDVVYDPLPKELRKWLQS